MFFEGIGDYVSVSARWYPDEQGRPSAVAAEALGRLEPILVERLEALVDATPEQESELRRQIAMGKFDQKWGLPARRPVAPERSAPRGRARDASSR